MRSGRPATPDGIIWQDGCYPQGVDRQDTEHRPVSTSNRIGTLDTDTAYPTLARVAVIGAGRLGTAMSAALEAAGVEVEGPLARCERPSGVDAALLCVPDAEIGAAAATVAGSARLVGHTSGATPLSALAPAGGMAFSVHPLQTFAGGEGPGRFQGAGCAVAGESEEAFGAASYLARRLGMTALAIEESQRGAYHAAASIASNFLVTLQAAAEQVAAGAGLEPSQARVLLAPLVRSTVENWAALGPERALTGPIARGDRATVGLQREAVADVAPELLALFDSLAERTWTLAGAEALS